jgi:monofunctional glycosyltransferase
LKKILLILLALLLAWIAWEWVTFPDVASLRTEDPETTAFMERRRKELRRAGKNDEIEYRFVSYDRISSNLRRAVLVSEDNAFYDHEGVDVEGMKEALRRNWEERRIAGGGSTITQQLAKNLYLSPSKNPLRKIKEYLIARAMEKELSKKRILEL